MKKIFLGAAVALFVIGCQKPPEGGNLGRLKLEKGTERYSGDHQGDTHGTENHAAANNHDSLKVAHDTIKTTDIQVVEVKADSTKNAAPAPTQNH